MIFPLLATIKTRVEEIVQPIVLRVVVNHIKAELNAGTLPPGMEWASPLVSQIRDALVVELDKAIAPVETPPGPG